MRPTRYFLMWDAGDADTTVVRQEDVPGRGERAYDAALELATCRADDLGLTVAIYRRIQIEDVTPAGDPRGLIWDWDDEFVTDISPTEAVSA